MPIQKLLKHASAGLALAVASVAHAVSFSLIVQTSDIRVGDTFDVAFSATADPALELSFFAFDVDPLDSFGANGVLSFNGWTVPDPIVPGPTFGPREVSGLGFPWDPAIVGENQLLATLTFTALSVGFETISIAGYLDDDQGIGLYALDSDELTFLDIAEQLDIAVRGADRVPESSSFVAFPATLLGLALLRRRVKERTPANR